MSTISDVITQTRELIQDTQEPYRRPDSALIGYLNNAFQEVKRLRPDLLLSQNFAIPTVTEADITAGTSFPISDMYFAATVEYVAGFAEMSNDEFALDGRAIALLNRFGQKLMGVGA